MHLLRELWQQDRWLCTPGVHVFHLEAEYPQFMHTLCASFHTPHSLLCYRLALRFSCCPCSLVVPTNHAYKVCIFWESFDNRWLCTLGMHDIHLEPEYPQFMHTRYACFHTPLTLHPASLQSCVPTRLVSTSMSNLLPSYFTLISGPQGPWVPQAMDMSCGSKWSYDSGAFTYRDCNRYIHAEYEILTGLVSFMEGGQQLPSRVHVLKLWMWVMGQNEAIWVGLSYIGILWCTYRQNIEYWMDTWVSWRAATLGPWLVDIEVRYRSKSWCESGDFALGYLNRLIEP